MAMHLYAKSILLASILLYLPTNSSGNYFHFIVKDSKMRATILDHGAWWSICTNSYLKHLYAPPFLPASIKKTVNLTSWTMSCTSLYTFFLFFSRKLNPTLTSSPRIVPVQVWGWCGFWRRCCPWCCPARRRLHGQPAGRRDFRWPGCPASCTMTLSDHAAGSPLAVDLGHKETNTEIIFWWSHCKAVFLFF